MAGCPEERPSRPRGISQVGGRGVTSDCRPILAGIVACALPRSEPWERFFLRARTHFPGRRVIFSSRLARRPTVQDETKLKLATWSSAKEICERGIRKRFRHIGMNQFLVLDLP